MIEVVDLAKHFGPIHVVDGISFQCRDSEIFGLLGPNGAGKTTTLRMLATVLRPTRGSARVDGYDIVREPTAVRRAIGVLSENTGLYGRLTAREHLRYFGELYGLNGLGLEERIEALLTALDMMDYADQRCEEFSKGMRQKVALGRALIHNPRTMILDEPTAGLDVMSARAVHAIIDGFRAEGRCVLLSTHIMSEAQRLCDRIAIIHKGRIQAMGTSEELRKQTGQVDLEEAFVRLVGEA